MTAATGDGSTMAGRVKRRDGVCWITGVDDPLVNSHICPKRMGDHSACIIYSTFTSLTPSPALSIYDEIFGLCLSETLDAWFDKYELGFRFVSTNTYVCHMFAVAPLGRVYTALGRARIPSFLPPLHGQPAGPPRPHLNNNPPAGLLRWHYLQCVLRRFAHQDYKTLANIVFSVLDLPFDSDSEGEGTDDEMNWPSAGFDRGRVAESLLEEHELHQQAVTRWVSSN
ncbi:hypothetical protein C8R47DRAFT_1157501 [Mycena vitilis]|nr:hypothetical protein C8R47DRAFT_1157501 [Mycena vitilis]